MHLVDAFISLWRLCFLFFNNFDAKKFALDIQRSLSLFKDNLVSLLETSPNVTWAKFMLLFKECTERWLICRKIRVRKNYSVSWINGEYKNIARERDHFRAVWRSTGNEDYANIFRFYRNRGSNRMTNSAFVCEIGVSNNGQRT